MHPSENTQPCHPFHRDHDSPPRSRQAPGAGMSIWAPQPQPSDTTWPKAIDSFASFAETRTYGSRAIPLPPIGREDVFGPVGPGRPKDIGAIGDGRKKISPGCDDTQVDVEQLLRALNLNSPDPYPQSSSRSLGLPAPASPGSPDFSPSSTTVLLTPTDMSPDKSFNLKLNSPYELGPSFNPHVPLPPSSLLFEPSSPNRPQGNSLSPSQPQPYHSRSSYSSQHHHHVPAPPSFPLFEPFSDHPSAAPPSHIYTSSNAPNRLNGPSLSWRHEQPFPTPSEWLRPDEKLFEYPSGIVTTENRSRSNSFSYPQQVPSHEPINFLSLLHPSSSPPYHVFVARIIKSSDQQASIFLQQKLKVADLEDRAKIVDAICARGFEMMAHRFGNWAVQRCLEAASTPDERRKIVGCMRGRIVELATNCYGCHVLQKALDCEEDIRLLIVSELLLGDPAQTLVNKHASHVWSKIMELTWTPPAPPIFAYVNKSLQGNWASLACHETGSLVVQHAFENLEESAKDGIVDEILNQGPAVFGEVAKNQWGSYCVQHILEHGSERHRLMTVDHLINGLLEYATHEQGNKSVTKALKEGGKEVLDRVVKRMCEPAKGARRAMIVDLALSATGSQLIASALPTADKDQRALLYDCIRGHIVTLRGCKTGSKVIWLFDRMRAYYGY